MKPKINASSSAAKSGGPGPADLVPFSRPIIVDPLPDDGIQIAIEASASERTALAALDGLVDLASFEAAFHVTRRPKGRVNVKGRVTAAITQTCVVSLEPFETAIVEEIDVDFMRAEDIARAERENAAARDQAKVEEDEADPPDPIIDGKIDLGALASEFLALSLDPYPRKPGVSLDEILPPAPEEKESPFAILRKLDKTS